MISKKLIFSIFMLLASYNYICRSLKAAETTQSEIVGYMQRSAELEDGSSFGYRAHRASNEAPFNEAPITNLYENTLYNKRNSVPIGMSLTPDVATTITTIPPAKSNPEVATSTENTEKSEIDEIAIMAQELDSQKTMITSLKEAVLSLQNQVLQLAAIIKPVRDAAALSTAIASENAVKPKANPFK